MAAGATKRGPPLLESGTRGPQVNKGDRRRSLAPNTTFEPGNEYLKKDSEKKRFVSH